MEAFIGSVLLGGVMYAAYYTIKDLYINCKIAKQEQAIEELINKHNKK